MLGIAVLVALAGSFALASGSANTLLVNKLDEFTDRPILQLLIVPTESGRGLIYFNCFAPGVILQISDPVKWGVSQTLVDVRLRFDKTPTIEDGWLWLPESEETEDRATGRALVMGSPPAVGLLSRAVESELLVAQVGGSARMRFDLKTANADLAEFLDLCPTIANTDKGYEFIDQRKVRAYVGGENGGSLNFECMSQHNQNLAAILNPPSGRRGRSRVNDPVRVTFGFNDEPVVEETWLWGNSGVIPDPMAFDTTTDLLHRAIRSERLTVRIGRSDTMSLDFSAARTDLVNFRSQCKAVRWPSSTGAPD